MVREVLENPDVSALEFLDKIHASLLSSEIYVFTPTGESKKLHKGATALDFAYYIHSKIGERAIAAKVNLKLVPLSHQLQNGDQVEIITAESQKPKREWLDFVTSTKAKRLIYDALKTDVKNSIKEGQMALDKELARLGVTPQNRVFKKLLLEYNLNNKDELYNKIGTGLIDLSELEKVLKKNNENKFVKFWNLQFFFGSSNENKRQIDKKKDYLLEENPLDKTLSYKVAECCNPIPGDPIIGFLDENDEVVIHKKVCHHAISLASRHGGKIVNAKWTKHTILSFLARINLKGIDRIGIVNEITKYITLVLSVNIRKIHFETHDGIFEGYIDLYVHNTEDLEVIMKRMLKIKGVESVVRTDIKE
jgi:GTP pyrophosphokinase